MTTVPPPGGFDGANGPYGQPPTGPPPGWPVVPTAPPPGTRGPGYPPAQQIWPAGAPLPAPTGPHYPQQQLPYQPPPQVWVDGRWITPPPPGSVPPAHLLSQVRSIGTAVSILLALTCLTTVAMLIADISWLNFLQRASDGFFFDVTEAEINEAAAFVENTTILWMVVFLATAVIFVIWFYRIRKNAGVWAPQRQRHSQGWSIGGWFCPIANFWFPFQIASDALEAARRPDDQTRSGTATIGWWWGLWITSFVVSLALRGLTGNLETIGDITSLAQVDIAFDVVFLAAGVAAILAVRTITVAQSHRINASPR